MNTAIKPEKAENKPKREQIAALAYKLWEKGGRLPARDQEYWFEAEKQLKASVGTSPVIASDPGAKPPVQTRSPESNHLRRAGNGRLRSEVAQR